MGVVLVAYAQGQSYRELLLPEVRHIVGVVVDQDGKPVAEAYIGHTDDRRQAHKTDADGKFVLDTKAPAVVIRKTGYRSEVVRTKEASDVQIRLQKSNAIFHVCTNGGQYQRLEGWGASFQFSKVPGIKASRQGQDIDYGIRSYYIDTKQGPKGIRHGSGPLWSSGEPLDSDVWRSSNYEETTYEIGVYTIIDARGQFPDGTRWRNLGKLGESASYGNVDEETAKILDRFLDGACLKPGTPAAPPTPNVIGEVPFKRRNEPKARMNPAEVGPGSPRVSWSQAAEGPRVKVVFSVDDTMELPAFKATCDRPCKNVMSEATGNYEPVPLSFDNEPNSLGLTLRYPRPLGAGVRILWVIRSLDERSIRITDFRILDIGEVPAELRH